MRTYLSEISISRANHGQISWNDLLNIRHTLDAQALEYKRYSLHDHRVVLKQ